MKIFRFCLIIATAILLFTACSDIDTKPVVEDLGESMDQESISEFIMTLYQTFRDENLKSFQSHMDEHGLYAISIYDDGREPNIALLVTKESVRKDLKLISAQSGWGVIGLSGGNFGFGIKYIHFNDFIIENNALDNVDWLVENEQFIHEQLADIIKGCQELILLNNEFIPQIFRLTDNLYAFSYSDIDDEDHSKFYGYWIIFEEIDESYIIRAIIELQ